MPISTSYRPPKEMLSNVSRGEDLLKRWGRGGKGDAAAITKGASAGLADGSPLSLDAIKIIKGYFDEHPDSFKPDNLEKDGGPSEDTINWLLAGGTAGKKWADRMLEKLDEDEGGGNFDIATKICKVDSDLGIVMGWAIVCEEDGVPYYDVQKDHIPPDAMLKASVDFMQGSRIVGDMHMKEEGGQVVFAFPMTAEIAKAFGIVTKNTGLMIAMKPLNKETLEKFKNGTYTGFSIGGTRGLDEPQE